jgi:hypothetical protein
MKVFLINSFNSSKYVQNAQRLSNQLYVNGFTSVIVYGGASDFACLQLSDKKWVISIKENLSDNNAFVGFERAFSFGHFRENDFRSATYIYIHDTCQLSDNFVDRVNKIPAVTGWFFAHIYGLYNIGVCDQMFLLTRANDLKGITHIPKDKSIALEQGETINVEGFEIKPLLYYGKRTLATVITDTISNCDFMSLNAIGESSSSKRFVTYIGALGLYKLVGSHVSYFVPVWATPSHEVRTQADYDTMKASFSKIQLSTPERVLGVITPWIPLPPSLD